MGRYPWVPYNSDAGLEDQLMGWTRVGNLTAVTAILDSPEGVELPNFSETALHEAIRWERPDILRYLVSRGFDVNQKGVEPYGEICLTPLHLVAANNSSEMVDILLDAGADATLDDVREDGTRGTLGGRNSEPHTPFMAAAFEGSDAVVQRLIDRITPDAIGSREWPLAIAAAASHRYPKTLDVLLRNYPAPGVPQDVLDRALADAAEYKVYDLYYPRIPDEPEVVWQRGIETFRLLLAHGARPNAKPPLSIYRRSWVKHRPIIHASIDRSMGMDMIHMLVDHGVDFPEGESGEISLFARAVRNGHPDLIRFFFEREGAVVDINEEIPETRFFQGGSLLHAAARSGRLASVQFLLDHGADPLMMNANGWLPVHQACQGRHPEIIKLLWPRTSPGPPDLANYRTKDGQIAFHLANCWSSYDPEDPEVGAHSMRLFNFFAEQGADLSSLDDKGRSILHHTLPPNEGMIPRFCTLMEAGAQLRADAQGQTKLHLFLRNTNCELVGLRFLLAHGADKDINAQDNEGRTPLYFHLEGHRYQPNNQIATMQIRDDVLDLLMETGADPDIRAVSGKSARDLLIEKGFPYDLDKYSGTVG
ncbi:hypothetical protein CBS147346_2392 [Aspergillus niger]|nr:hypothetical protein CBS147346_2392 [Aspergillus niger]